MPYSLSNPPKKLVKKIKKRHPKAGKKEVKQFIHIFNSAIKDGDGEATAFAKAWGVLNKNKKLKSSHRKTNPAKTKKEIEKQDKKSSFDISDKLLSLSETLSELGLKKESIYIAEIAYEEIK